MFSFKSSWYHPQALSYPSQKVMRQGSGRGGFFGTRADGLYVDWLCATRDMERGEAVAFAQGMDSRKLISQHTYAGDGEVVSIGKPKSDPVALVCSKIRKLDWSDLERIQAAIDARLLATELPKAA